VLTIADISEVIVKASFPDSVVPDIKEGDPVIVRPNDLPGESMAGKVSLVSRSTDPASRATEIWVRLANGAGRLRTGGSADVVISENTVRDAIVVPDSAVVLDEATGRTGVVFVVDPAGIAHEKKVEIGIRNGRITQIVKGIAEGETVITEGNYALPDGTKVSVRNSGQDASGAEE
jgi:RND family efflux transporter MFP subunit